jgi:membrane protease YdiL (CAAX protease family)
MATTSPLPTRSRTAPAPAAADAIPQYSLPKILGVWAAAALPMAALAWIVAPWLADRLDGASALPRALLLVLTAGLIWQFALIVILLWREQGTLRWSRVRDALWLNPPPRRAWLLLPLLAVGFGAEELVPQVHHAVSRDFGTFLGSHAGHVLFAGSWSWFALIVTLALFNTVLGEELLFRGLLLPRMNGVFGRRDWLANGVLFACYHLHMPWAIPATLADSFFIAYPSKRYRSAWIGIAVHSVQSVFIVAAVLALVLG